MNKKDKALILELKKRLPLKIKKHLKRFIIFGSRVTGEAYEDSDLDVIALVDRKTAYIEKNFDDIVYQVMWDNDFKPIISLKIFSESKYNTALNKGYSFYKNVENQGITL